MKVALINMPFISSNRPSIQLGLLKAYVEANVAGCVVNDFYLNIDFSKFIGDELYEPSTYGGNVLLGEWLFSKAAFGLSLNSSYLDAIDEDLLRLYPNQKLEKIKSDLIEIRESKAEEWINEILKKYDWSNYDLVGFSCTFCQTNASLTLARRLKESYPKIKIIFGGSAFEGQMGEEVYARASSFIDCIFQGEGELELKNYIEKIMGSSPLPTGIIKSKALVDLNTLPIPDYVSYFKKMPKAEWLLIESSRGCWWGEKKHCTFCGLNGETMKYRSKNSEVFLAQLSELERKYECKRFEAVDNILDHRYIDTALEILSQKKHDYKFFYEIKANISHEKFKTLVAAGVTFIQPGIESLSTEILHLMNKGVTAAQNILLLQLARTYNSSIIWNLLYGFPGETDETYREILNLLPKLFHLAPPGFTGPVRLDRFSPYFNEYIRAKETNDSSYSKFSDVKPSIYYEMCFPNDWNFWKLAYYYSSRASTNVKKETYKELAEIVKQWQNFWALPKKPRLEMRLSESKATIIDTRFGIEKYKAYEIKGPHLLVAEALTLQPKTFDSLQSDCKSISNEDLLSILNSFEKSELIACIDQRYIWLPITYSSETA